MTLLRYTEASAKGDIDAPEFDFIRNCVARLCASTPGPDAACSPNRRPMSVERGERLSNISGGR